MPRNITSMDVAALKGPAGMAQCGAEALEALSALKGEDFDEAGSSGAQEPEPEPEVAADGADETTQETFLRAEALFRQICGSDLPSVHADLQKLVSQCLAKLAACAGHSQEIRVKPALAGSVCDCSRVWPRSGRRI